MLHQGDLWDLRNESVGADEGMSEYDTKSELIILLNGWQDHDLTALTDARRPLEALVFAGTFVMGPLSPSLAPLELVTALPWAVPWVVLLL